MLAQLLVAAAAALTTELSKLIDWIMPGAATPQVIDWDGFAELEMVTLACVALRAVTISHCDSLLDATCATFSDGAGGNGGAPGSSNWRCPDLRRAAFQQNAADVR